ncbi:MAG: PDZ domain-containing protein, partial [Chloroflexota bacterium]
MRYKIILLLFSLALSVTVASAQDATATAEAGQESMPAATIVNDEGGPVAITGDVAYTYGFFTNGVDEPEVILEDEAGFVDRNRGFIMPEKSQVLGQITSDFYTSPFDYNIQLPIVPAATLRDVDNNGKTDTGVMIYGIAYWTNTWGDPYLEQRDLYGGGWSGAYASFRIDPNPSAHAEVIGGKYLVYAPDDKQAFPSGFGADKKLFTADDPTVGLPAGYTVVDMDSDPFTFDRSRNPVIDLIEGEGAEQPDFSAMSYSDAFKAMVDMFRKKYAYTELKNIDWDAKEAEYLPRFEEADKNQDSAEYQHALRDFIWSIPDGHLSAPVDNNEFAEATSGGLGMAIRDVDDGRVIVNFLSDDGPAAAAGIELKAEIISIDGTPISDAVNANIPWSSPFGSDIVRRLQQLRYVLRSPIGTDVTIEYKNPGDSASKTADLTSVQENASFRYSSFSKGLTGLELPVQYTILDSGYIKINLYSFFDSARLTIQLWERVIKILNDNQIPGVIIDMRQNGGGSGFLA